MGRNATLEPVDARSERPEAVGAAGVTYREPLRVPWWWYPVGIFVAVLLAAEFRIAGFDLTIWLPFTILPPLACVFVWGFGRGALEIRDGEVRIRGAHIPLRYVSGAVALDALTLRRVVGREGDPAAFVSIRPWVKPGVQLWLDDPDDPTPYWIVSTRHPQRFVDLVRAGR
jgi:Protein of unknown function (DUF3093)